MKFVVDVNVLVSGSLWAGNPARLLDAILDGSATCCVSAPILVEFEEVIHREKFRKRLEQNGITAHEVISRFRAVALNVDSIVIPVPSTLRDRDDIHILACAVYVCADLIVTGDDDLLSMETFENIPILSVRDALNKLGISPV